jgi:hypothetical protein
MKVRGHITIVIRFQLQSQKAQYLITPQRRNKNAPELSNVRIHETLPLQVTARYALGSWQKTFH